MSDVYSAINQQIALKTVRKFGFSVNAVWNGQQALDYLLEQPTPTRPRPDIILMDVQMPILDGYRATHFIRHHKPYAAIDSIRAIPIVAMTASAIQGDKEKCQKAGMDDYLAKPVRGPTLERMLIKWAIEGQKPTRLKRTSQFRHDDDASNCTDPSSSSVNITTEAESFSEMPQTKSTDSTRGDKVHTITNSSLRALSSEGDAGMQRAEAEEKATTLRDDKLIAATEPNPSFAEPSSHNNTNTISTLQRKTTPPASSRSPIRPAFHRAALTEENIGRLDRSQAQAQETSNHIPPTLRLEDSQGQSSSMLVSGSEEETSTVGSLSTRSKGLQRPFRGTLERNRSDWSESTVRNKSKDRRREMEGEEEG